jgi:DNA-binding CsgD family transcriptional regulator
VTAASVDRLRHELIDVAHRGSDLHDFSLRATRAIQRVIAFDGVCMVLFDPATGLPTGEVSKDALPTDTNLRIAQIEIEADDVNVFRALTRSGVPAASLSEATRGDLNRSRRHRELRAPNGFGDELRTTLVSDGVAWGGLTLLRADDCGPFATTDVDLMASLSQCLAEGLRQAVLLAALRGARHADEGDAGLVLVADDDSVVMTDAAGQAWLRQIGSDVIAAVAGWARATGGDDARFARARVRAATGTWLVVRGSALSGEGDARTAVTIEPAGAHDLAPLIVDAYGLTERERVITQLVAQGLSTKTIAGHLRISPWTVQDHLKSVFEKVGVRTRGELVSRVFLEHFAPRVAEPDGPAPPRGLAPALRGSADTTNGR